MCSINWDAIVGFLQALAGFAGAGAVVWVGNAARSAFQQTVETRRGEITFQTALDALALANQTDIVFGTLRSIATFADEGASRNANALETPEQKSQRDYRHVMNERLESTREFFDKVSVVEPHVRALFGDVPADALRNILRSRNRVAVSWGMHCNWQEGRPMPSDALVQKIEATIWEGYGEPDELKLELDAGTALIRKQLEPLVRNRGARSGAPVR